MTLKRSMMVSGVASLAVVLSKVIRYHGMSEEDRLPYLFGLRTTMAFCSLPAVAVGVVVLLFFLFEPIPKCKR